MSLLTHPQARLIQLKSPTSDSELQLCSKFSLLRTPCRDSIGLSPPVTMMAPLADEFVARQQPQEGWQGQSGEKDDEVELMYDATLNCFYDPKTCKYYVLQ